MIEDRANMPATGGTPFQLMVLIGGCAQAGKTISSAHLVLPWILVALGAPAMLIASVLPLWRAARFFTRLVSATWIDRQPLLRPVILVIVLSRLAAVAVLAAALYWSSGPTAFAAILVTAAVFGATDGAGPACGRRQMAKMISKDAVGRLLSMQSVAGGVVTMGLIGVHILLQPTATSDSDFLTHLALSGAAYALALAGAVMLLEPQGMVQPVSHTPSRWPKFGLLRSDPWLRRYAVGGVLGQSVILAPPFIAVMIGSQATVSYAVLIFIAALMTGGIVGGAVWGGLVAARAPLVALGTFGTMALATVLAMVLAFEHALAATWAFVPIFMLTGVATAGYRAIEAAALVAAVKEGSIAQVSAVVDSITALCGVGFGFGIGLAIDSLASAEAGLLILLCLQLAGAVLWNRLLGAAVPEPRCH